MIPQVPVRISRKNWATREYESNPQFKILMDGIQDTFDEMMPTVKKYKVEKLKGSRIIEYLGRDVHNIDVMGFYGMFEPPSEQLFDDVFLLFLKFMSQFVQHIEGHYHIVFFNTHCSNYKTFVRFRQMMKTLPMRFYCHLQNIVIVHPTFAIRSVQWLSFGKLNELLSKHIILANSLKELGLQGVLTKQIYQRLPKQIVTTDKPTLGLELCSSPQEAILKKRISDRNDIIGLAFDEYEMSQIGVPTLLKMLCCYFFVRPQKLLTEGLFRKNANEETLLELENECRSKNYNFIDSVNDPHAVASLIKKIFYHSKWALFSYEQYRQVQMSKDPQALNEIEHLVQTLPGLHYRILQFLIEFLKYKVAAQEASNKMNIYSLSVVFAPCLFRPLEYRMEDLKNSPKYVKVLQVLINNFQRIFGDYEHQSRVYRTSSDMQNEESRRIIASRLQGKKYDPAKEKMRKSIPMSEILDFD